MSPNAITAEQSENLRATVGGPSHDHIALPWKRDGYTRKAFVGLSDVFVTGPRGSLTGWVLSAQTAGCRVRLVADMDHDPTDAECRRWLAYAEETAARVRAEAVAVLAGGGW